MTNPFVAYLNSLHNEQASNQNAIAEMQIHSEYFTCTQVKRDLIPFLCEHLKKGEFVVLTGHAGDGKTTLLAQVLEELGLPYTSLKEQDTIEGAVSLKYIKDFSELKTEEQDQALASCFERQAASLLIANTGPLLNAMERMSNADDLENTLLNAMDVPTGASVIIDGCGSVFILNIARVDNTDFIRPYLRNIIVDELWAPCAACAQKHFCPMYFNQQLIKGNFDRVATFIENAYIWLQEHDSRATIRQITAHLTYAMTGGIHCESVQEQAIPMWRYRYLFSNLLWGSVGIKDDIAAQQIRGIRLLNECGFDQRTTSIDYELFVKGDIDTYFSAPLKEMFKDARKYLRPVSIANRQKALKRAYLLFGHNSSDADAEIQKQVFSEWFPMYLEGRNTGKKPPSKVKRGICQAINTLFVGETYDDSATSIHLTLRRTNEQMSNVQLLCGKIAEDSVSLRFVSVPAISSQHKLYRLVLRVDDKIEFPIGLPLLNYFFEVQNGVIVTDIDPMLSNGIDSLKAQLLSKFSKSSSDGEIALLYLQGSTWKTRKIYVTDHRIER